MRDMDRLTELVEEAGRRPPLLRVLGPGTAMAIVIGNVIGSGIFAKPGTIAAEAGEFGLILAAWVVGGALCLLGAFSFAELAAMLPQAGGLYVYLREAYGRPVAFLFGWNEFLFKGPASVAALAVIFTGSLQRMLGWQSETIGSMLVAVAVIGAMTYVNVLGVIWGGRVQIVTTLVKAGFVALLAALPFLLMPIENDFRSENYATTVASAGQGDWTARFGIVLLAVLWAYNGWEGVSPVAEEIRDPRRNLPIALVGGVGLLIVLYVGANVAYHGVLSMQEMADAREHAAEEMVGRLLGSTGGMIMSAVIMCSTFGAINSNMLIGPRIPFAMGRDGVFPKTLGWVHVNYRTPAAAIVVQGLMGIALVVTSGILVAFVAEFKNQSIFDLLTDFVIFAGSIFLVLGVASVIVLRVRRPDWPRPYRVHGYPFVPILYVLFYLWFLAQVYLGKPFEANAGLVMIGAGLPVYAYFAYRR